MRDDQIRFDLAETIERVFSVEREHEPVRGRLETSVERNPMLLTIDDDEKNAARHRGERLSRSFGRSKTPA